MQFQKIEMLVVTATVSVTPFDPFYFWKYTEVYRVRQLS